MPNGFQVMLRKVFLELRGSGNPCLNGFADPEVHAIAAERWNSMTAEQRQPYRMEAIEQKLAKRQLPKLPRFRKPKHRRHCRKGFDETSSDDDDDAASDSNGNCIPHFTSSNIHIGSGASAQKFHPPSFQLGQLALELPPFPALDSPIKQLDSLVSTSMSNESESVAFSSNSWGVGSPLANGGGPPLAYRPPCGRGIRLPEATQKRLQTNRRLPKSRPNAVVEMGQKILEPRGIDEKK